MTFRTHAAGIAAALAITCIPGFLVTAQAAEAADWTVSGNAGLFTDYRFRGISQTNKRPAIQGGVDVAHTSGFYAGNWNSNIDSGFFNDSNIEMDFYGGFKGSVDAFSYDVGAIYYYYPGSDAKIDNTELYVGGGWGPLSLKYSYAVSDFFSFPGSKGSYYVDATVAYPVAPGLTLIGHVGYQGLKGDARVFEIDGSGPKSSVTDWKIGATYDFKGWVLGASYIGTDRDLTGGTAAATNRNISGDTLVVSVAKSF